MELDSERKSTRLIAEMKRRISCSTTSPKDEESEWRFEFKSGTKSEIGEDNFRQGLLKSEEPAISDRGPATFSEFLFKICLQKALSGLSYAKLEN